MGESLKGEWEIMVLVMNAKALVRVGYVSNDEVGETLIYPPDHFRVWAIM
ncbi:uncharacterized protein G2W53_008167 [Senna tora]|uniref:Uncharacterized protein n=1 Tax=Senna tora TaxID=362788 RepID=A0A835CGP7_9FABA|nr:uncharacterized protein G2W53_008167 [Senna tora]